MKNTTLIVRLTAFFSLLATLLSMPAMLQAKEFYKWVDEDGVTHYTQTPPDNPNTKTTKIKASGSVPSSAESAQQRLQQSRESFMKDAEKRAATKGMDDEEKEKYEKLKESCDRAKNNLKVISERARIREKGKDGEFKVLTDEEKQARIKENQDYIDQNCKGI